MTALAGLPIEATATRPDGSRVRQYDEDVWLVEHHGEFHIEAPGIRIPLAADEVARAGLAVPNLIAARLHEARRTPVVDDPVLERLAGMLAAALRTAVAA